MEKSCSIVEPIAVPVLNLACKWKRNGKHTSGYSHLYQYREALCDTAKSLLNYLPKLPIFEQQPSIEEIPETIGATATSLQSYHLYADGEQTEPLSFSFSSSGGMVFYDLGAAKCIRDKVKPSILSQSLFVGSSFSSVVAAAMAFDLDLDSLKDSLKGTSVKSSCQIFGPFSGLSKPFRAILNAAEWPDVTTGKDRLFLSLTNLPWFKHSSRCGFKDKKV